MEHTTVRGEWIERFMRWAKSREEIRAVILVGSMGRQDRESADEWSDVDLLFITTNLERYANDNSWMKEIGGYWSGVLPSNEIFGDWIPVHCGFSTFEGGVDAEFFILSSKHIQRSLYLIRFLNRFPFLRRILPESVANLGADAGELFQNEVSISFDKDGLAKNLIDATLEVPVEPSLSPSPKKFQENVDDFWIGPSRIVAHLQRGQLMGALKTLDTGRRGLLKMAEQHARAYRLKKLESWGDPRVKEMLPGLYPNYNADEIWGALFALMELYSWLAEETAKALGYPCVSEACRIIAWVGECFAEYSQVNHEIG